MISDWFDLMMVTGERGGDKSKLEILKRCNIHLSIFINIRLYIKTMSKYSIGVAIRKSNGWEENN